MILDPNRNGIEVFYNNKIRNLEGSPLDIVNWIIEITSDRLKEIEDEDDVYNYNKFYHLDEWWIQYSIPYLDCMGLGRVYADIFMEKGYLFEKANVKRIKF